MEFLLIGFALIGSLSGFILVGHAILRTFREFQDQAQLLCTSRVHAGEGFFERAQGLRHRSDRIA